MGKGRKHDVQPEVDPFVSISFDAAPSDDEPRGAWMLSAGHEVCKAVTGTPEAYRGFSGILQTLGEDPAWSFLDSIVVNSGFDVYDGDAVFEVYPANTPEPIDDVDLSLVQTINTLAFMARWCLDQWVMRAPPEEAAAALKTYPAEIPELQVIEQAFVRWAEEIRSELNR